jgi:hypothetical protein
MTKTVVFLLPWRVKPVWAFREFSRRCDVVTAVCGEACGAVVVEHCCLPVWALVCENFAHAVEIQNYRSVCCW